MTLDSRAQTIEEILRRVVEQVGRDGGHDVREHSSPLIWTRACLFGQRNFSGDHSSSTTSTSTGTDKDASAILFPSKPFSHSYDVWGLDDSGQPCKHGVIKILDCSQRLGRQLFS